MNTESPIERLFREGISPRLNESVRLTEQVKCETPWGLFIPDFVIEVGSDRIAVECDGEEFHDESRDEWRDWLLLSEKSVDEVFRFPGAALHWRLEDCLFAIFHHHPGAFSLRGRNFVERMATEEAKQQIPERDDRPGSRILVDYRSPRGSYIRFDHRHLRRHPRPYEDALIRYSNEHRGLRLDDVMAKWRSEQRAKEIP